MYSVSNFISKFQIGARPNLFRVEIDQLGNSCQFMCKGAQIPGRSVSKLPVTYLDSQFYIGGDTTYQDWSINVMNDIDYDVRFRLEDWMNMIKQQGETRGHAGWTYLMDGRVTQLGPNGEDVITYVLFNMFPVDVTPIDLSWETTSTIEEYQVTFSFSHFGKEKQ